MRRLSTPLALLATLGCASSAPPASNARAALSDEERGWLQLGPYPTAPKRQPVPTAKRQPSDVVRTALVAAAKTSEGGQGECLAGHPGAKGTVAIAFAVNEGGRVAKARVVYDDIENAEISECLLRLVEAWALASDVEGLPTRQVHAFSFPQDQPKASHPRTARSLVTKMPQGITIEPCCVSTELVRREVDEHIGLIQRCYEHELANDPTLAGKVTMEWTISATGDIESPRAREATLKSDKAIACMSRALTAMAYPPAGKAAVVSYPFNFANLDMDPDTLRKAIGLKATIVNHGRELSQCQARHPESNGRLELSWALDPDGTVRKGSIRVVNNDLGPEMTRCIRDAVSTWRFPPPADQKPAYVTFPFRFRSDSF